MRRRLLIGFVALLVFGSVLVTGACATPGVRATLTHAIHPGPPGTRVVLGWKLRDTSGRLVLDRHVFVKITCPEGDGATTTYANPNRDGLYVVSATVPPGGVGSITVGRGGSTFPVTNPYHG